MTAKITCGRQDCNRPGRHSVDVTVDGKTMTARMCSRHLGEFRRDFQKSFGASLDLQLTVRSSQRHRLQGYVARSGKIFSAAEARAWAVKQGIAKPSAGRLPTEIRDAYAATH